MAASTRSSRSASSGTASDGAFSPQPTSTSATASTIAAGTARTSVVPMDGVVEVGERAAQLGRGVGGQARPVRLPGPGDDPGDDQQAQEGQPDRDQDVTRRRRS